MGNTMRSTCVPEVDTPCSVAEVAIASGSPPHAPASLFQEGTRETCDQVLGELTLDLGHRIAGVRVPIAGHCARAVSPVDLLAAAEPAVELACGFQRS